MTLPYREQPQTEYRFTQQDLSDGAPGNDINPWLTDGDLKRPAGEGWELVAAHVVQAWERERSYSTPKLVAVWRKG